MKNVFLFQFNDEEIKKEFKRRCAISGETMHVRMTKLIDGFLGLEAEREKEEAERLEIENKNRKRE